MFDRIHTSSLGAVTLCAASILTPSPVRAAACAQRSDGFCAQPGVACSPIDNPDKSSAERGSCTNVPGRHPTGNTCECRGKLDVHPPPPDYLWDLVPSKFGLDPNGLYRMPNWKWAATGPPQGEGFDVCDFCPCKVGTWGIDAPDHQEGAWLESPSCTHGPIHENSNNLCSGEPAHLGQNASGVGYHMNWWPVEYEGPLQWEDHSEWLVPFSSGDNEYTFNILRPDLALVTRGRETKGIHLEFDSTETVDEWDGTGTWWDHFHHDVVDHLDNNAIHDALGAPLAVVVGMLGLDVAHADHHAELHPVYAMFIRDPPGAAAPPAGEVRWSFFVRNWGSEGACGHDTEQLWIDHLDMQLPDRRLGSVINVRPYRHGADHGACPQEWSIDPNGVLRFPMASPEMKCGWIGEITMVRARVKIGPVVSVPAGLEQEQAVEPQATRIARLSPSARQELIGQLLVLRKESGSRPAFGAPIAPKRLSRPLPPAVPFKAASRVVRAAPDPTWQAQQARERQLVEEFLKAHDIR